MATGDDGSVAKKSRKLPAWMKGRATGNGEQPNTDAKVR